MFTALFDPYRIFSTIKKSLSYSLKKIEGMDRKNLKYNNH